MQLCKQQMWGWMYYFENTWLLYGSMMVPFEYSYEENKII